MNYKRGVLVVLLWVSACGGGNAKPDGGAGGDGGSGGASGGSGGAGGSSADGGNDAGVGETFSFLVVEGDSAVPVMNVAVRLAGPNSFVDATSRATGRVDLTLPGPTQRPLTLTLTRLNYGVLSIVGLTNEFPTQVRLDRTDLVRPQMPLAGYITGRSAVGSTVVVDSFDFSTVSTQAPNWFTQYTSNSPHSLPIVGLELDSIGQLLNWTVADAGVRNVLPASVNVAFPTPPAAFSNTPWSAAMPDAGILISRPHAVTVQGWQVLKAPQESWVVSGSGSVTATAAGFAGAFCGVTGALAPNRMLLEASDQSSYLMRYRQADLTPPIAVALPEVDQISVSGTSLGTLSAQAVTPEPFDSLALTVELQGGIIEVWRVYTAPGAPLSIDRLPDLPAELTPSALSIATPATALNALPMLIRFEDPAMRPWLLQNANGPLDAYRVTFGGQYTQINGTWR